MEGFGPDMHLAAQHLPVLVNGDEGDLFDGKARFEKAAWVFVAQVMEVQVFNTDLHAGAAARTLVNCLANVRSRPDIKSTGIGGLGKVSSQFETASQVVRIPENQCDW